jgi:uncharacterized protein (TIGR03067 family)
MPAVEEHRSAAELEAFAQGLLPESDCSAVEAHLALCPACRQLVDETPGDTFVSLLRAARTRFLASADTPSEFRLSSDTGVWERGETVALAEPPAELADHPRYRPIRSLGAGGMGSVWLAEHKVMGRLVALKLIRPEFLARAEGLERFRRETQVLAQLAHRHLVGAHDAEQAGNLHFLVMEYLDGVTLADRVASEGPLAVTEACRCVREAALGLQHAHEHGLVHRDLKPQNLMLVNEPGAPVKVLDFGLAVLAVRDPKEAVLTGKNMVVGTPDYIAPEQAEDARSADIRSDVYSLGCTLYFLLAGDVPFPEESTLRKLVAHQTSAPKPIRSLRPEVPPGLAAVLGRMMAKDPADRYQTPAEVAEALAPFAAGIVPAGTTSTSQRRRRWLGTAAAWLAGFVLVAAGVVYRIQTDNGEVVINVDSPDVELVLLKGGTEVEVIDTKTQKRVRVPVGTYDVQIKNKPDGIEVTHTDRIVIARGKEALVTIERGNKVARQPVGSDKERILGTWRGVAVEVGGQPIPREFIDAIRPTVTFTAEKVTAKPSGTLPKEFLEFVAAQGVLPRETAAVLEKGVEGIYHLDPTKSPKAIDIVYLGPVRKIGLGIYTLDGDTLKVCGTLNPDRVDERPKEFATKQGVMRVLVTLERQPPEKDGKESSPEKPAPVKDRP